MNGLPTLLAIGAHPDDLEIGCGGALMRWSNRYRLVLAVATDGERARPVGADRILEAEKVAAGFGATLERLGLPDGDLGPTVGIVAALEVLEARHRPSRVLIPSRHDSHQDHRALGRAAVTAFRRVDDLLAYESHSTERFAPTLFVDITDSIDRKCELLAHYESQLGKVATSTDYVRTTARAWSLKRGFRDGYLEAFEVVRLVDRDG